MKKPMEVYFHGAREGVEWRGQVISTSGELKARTNGLLPTQEQAIEQARQMWQSLQQKLQAVAS